MNGEDNGTMRIIGAADAADEQETEYYTDWRDDWSPEHLAFIRARTRAAVWAFMAALSWLSFFACIWLLSFGRITNPKWLYVWGAAIIVAKLFEPRGGK